MTDPTLLTFQRCEVCGWPLQADPANGCTLGNCSQRPKPKAFNDDWPETQKDIAVILAENTAMKQRLDDWRATIREMLLGEKS